MLGSERWDLTAECFEDGVLDWDEYREAILNPTVMTLAITVWSNNIEVDATGTVLNEERASFRAFQVIRSSFDPSFYLSSIIPPVEQWEMEENQF